MVVSDHDPPNGGRPYRGQYGDRQPQVPGTGVALRPLFLTAHRSGGVAMSDRKETALMSARDVRNPLTLLRQMTSELDRMFEDPFWPSFRWPSFMAPARTEAPQWMPKIDVFERDKHLIVKADLPGMRKDDVKVEVTDGYLAISGERKRETEERKDSVYRAECEYGSFYRTIPLPDGVAAQDVKATFSDGVLEVSLPLPARSEPKPHRVAIQEAPKTAKSAA
jgi:HSP20 family protein